MLVHIGKDHHNAVGVEKSNLESAACQKFEVLVESMTT